MALCQKNLSQRVISVNIIDNQKEYMCQYEHIFVKGLSVKNCVSGVTINIDNRLGTCFKKQSGFL